jgi:hypothetical protein
MMCFADDELMYVHDLRQEHASTIKIEHLVRELCQNGQRLFQVPSHHIFSDAVAGSLRGSSIALSRTLP